MEGRAFLLLEELSAAKSDETVRLMLAVSEAVKAWDGRRSKESFNALLTRMPGIQTDCRVLPLLFLPVAYADASLPAVNELAFFLARRVADSERLMRDVLMTVAAVKWSHDGFADTAEYVARLFNLAPDFVDDDLPAGEYVLEALAITCREGVPEGGGSSVKKAIREATENAADADLRAAIAAALAVERPSQCSRKYSSYAYEEFGGEYPTWKRRQGSIEIAGLQLTTTGYLRMDGFTGWQIIRDGRPDVILLGDRHEPFPGEVVHYRWMKEVLSRQLIVKAIEDAYTGKGILSADWQQGIKHIGCHWFNREVTVTLASNEQISLSFSGCRLRVLECSYGLTALPDEISLYSVTYAERDLGAASPADDTDIGLAEQSL